MTTPSLPQDRAALIDKDFRVTLPYRRWMNDVTKELVRLGSATTGEGTATFPEVTFTGSTWINVTGSLESGNINVSLREGITTDDLPEGADNLYWTSARHSGNEAHDFTTDANYTLTDDQSAASVLVFTDTGVVLTTGRDGIYPAAFPHQVVVNNTAQTLTLKKSGQSGVTLAAGATCLVASGPTDVVKVIS